MHLKVQILEAVYFQSHTRHDEEAKKPTYPLQYRFGFVCKVPGGGNQISEVFRVK